MLKKTFLVLTIATLAITTSAIGTLSAETDLTGKIVKLADSSTLYYVASDGNRYVFPNEKTYKSWYTDFSNVTEVTEDDLSQYPLVGNIRYRPGVLLLKIQTDPKVYAVSQGGILHWIRTEMLARKLYGENWSQLIDDISASFFANYTVGQDIDEEEDFDADEEVDETETIESNRGLKIGHLPDEIKAQTKRCRAIPAVPGKKLGQTVRAISARECKLKIITDAQNGEVDETPPVITGVSTTVATSSAIIAWTTDEESTSKVEYADESLTTASSTDVVTNSDLVTSHSLELTGLTPSTTYYFMVQSADANSNIASTTEDMFTTLAE